MSNVNKYTPVEVRLLIRKDELIIPTAGLCPGYVQANLVILRKKYAEDFKEFIYKNPKPCPLLEIIDNGKPISNIMAKECDITTDIPMYRVFVDGVLIKECTNVKDIWEEDMVAFLIGCSLTFEYALIKAGIRLKHYEENKRVPMFDTNIKCESVKMFKGNYVVSMRPIKKKLIDLAVSVTSEMDYAHGAPVHIGNPKQIGIEDIYNPDYGDRLDIQDDEIPVFWACGVTPQAVARNAKLDLMITHSPGFMLISDVNCNDL